ncbi:MAG: FAD-dependent oxidoreductase [Fimbriimonadaceae bacterium]|nr:FAD-dependent oxidoreductase [Fimbriimonadaceae bacterium]
MRVAVIGAGPAGLRTAQLLERRGVEVQVFEARDRVGGRLHTVRLPGGGWYEAGAEWLDRDHERCLKLMAEFGLEPEISRAWPGKVLWRGDIRPQDNVWPDAEQDAEAVHREASALCDRLAEIPWESADLAHLDQVDLADFLDSQCISPVGRWWTAAVQRSDEGEDPERVGLLGWLVGYRHYLRRQAGDMSLYRIPGGAQALCERMAATLKRPILTRHALQSIGFQEEAVELWFEGEMAFAGAAVLAIPPGPLLQVDMGGTAPPEKELAWELLGSSRAVKVCLSFSQRWWDRDGWSGRMISDLPCRQFWDGGRDGAAVISCYVCGDAAEDLLARPDPVETCLRSLAEIDAQASDLFLSGQVHDWIGDPFSLGAFTHLAPGAVMGSLPHLRTPIGRVSFAGEYTSDWLGFVEGALESAERATREILKWQSS